MMRAVRGPFPEFLHRPRRHLLGPFLVLAGICLFALPAGPVLGRERRLRSKEDLPRKPAASKVTRTPVLVPMSREEVARAAAGFMKRFVEERGVKKTAEVFRRYNEGRKGAAGRSIPDPEGAAMWYSYSSADEIAGMECEDIGAVYAAFVEAFGIQFHYVLADGAEGDVLESEDLCEVIAQLLFYPDEILYYLGHRDPPMPVYLYAPDYPDDPCGDAFACFSYTYSEMKIPAGAASATVHETGHAIYHYALYDNQDDPDNPLKGHKEDFDEIFAIPGEWEWITYDNYQSVFGSWGQLSKPPGFVSGYAVVNFNENFADSCAEYVADPRKFLSKARRQALAGPPHIGLALQYRFLRKRVFLYRSYTELIPPQRAVVALRTVDEGDGDGRIEPGEYFSLDLSIVPLDDLLSAQHLRCLPVGSGVISSATSEFTDGLEKGQRYDFPEAFRFRLSSFFQGEGTRAFLLKYYAPQGALSYIGWDSVSLNEQGYLWAWNEDPYTLWHEDPESAWSETGKAYYRDPDAPEISLLRLTSTLKEVELLEWPEELLGELPINNYHVSGRTLYDPSGDFFWVCGYDLGGSIFRIPREDPGMFDSFAIDPEGQIDDEDASGIEDVRLNPLDGSLWVTVTDANTVLRCAVDPAGEPQRLFVHLDDVAGVPWKWTRDMEIDPATGKVWFISPESLLLLSPEGEAELALEGFSNLRCVAPASDGGCWLTSSAFSPTDHQLIKISPDGETQFDTDAGFSLKSLVYHPADGALWARAKGEGSSWWLLTFTPWGYQMSARAVSSSSYPIIPSAADKTVFVKAYKDAERYQHYGKPLYRATLHARPFTLFGYQPAGD